MYINLQGQKADSIKLTNALKPVEEIYGLGEMWNGSVAQRGKKVELWDKNGTPDECAYIPYYVTTSNYAYYLDYGGRVIADIGNTDQQKIILTAPASSINVFLSSGNSIAEAASNHLKIVGLPVVPPRWTFKPWFWLMSAQDQPKGDILTLHGEDVLIAARKLKELDIPVSATWLEPPWQTARTSFVPSAAFAKDFKGFIDELHAMDIKVLCWTVPYTLPNSSNWDSAIKNNFLVKKPNGQLPEVTITKSGEMTGGGYHYIDFTNPAAKQWWQNQIGELLKFGIDGFKLDAGQDLPEDAVLYNGKSGKDFHNSYAFFYNKAFYEKLNTSLKGDFLTIPRAASAGAAKYLTFKWPGDLSTSFASNGLPSAVYSAISGGFSGFSSVNTDIGGFSPRPANEDVWLRWSQFGAMLPGMQTLHMPWWFSKKASNYYRYLSWLHTEMTPLWMTLARNAHETGVPICRHLVYTYQDDHQVWNVDDEYTIGESILVAPIITPTNSRKVYLPKGNWFNFWTNEKISGQQEIQWEGDLYTFPLYVKEGAIIPLEVKNDVTGFGDKRSSAYLTLAIWPDFAGKSSFTLHDTGKPIAFTVTGMGSKSLKVNWPPSDKKCILKIQWKGIGLPSNITDLTGTKSKITNNKDHFFDSNQNCWYYDTTKKELWIKKISSNNKPNSILIN